MTGDEWRWVLTLSGVAFEGAGLTLFYVDATRSRRREGDPGIVSRGVRRLRSWLSSGFGRRTHSVGQSVSIPYEVRSSVGVQSSAEGIANETELARLNRQVAELFVRIPELSRRLDDEMSKLGNEIRRAEDHVNSRIAALESEQRSIRRSALRLEARGAVLFIVGACLSAAANLV